MMKNASVKLAVLFSWPANPPRGISPLNLPGLATSRLGPAEQFIVDSSILKSLWFPELRRFSRLVIVGGLVATGLGELAHADELAPESQPKVGADASAAERYYNEVETILADHCFSCHGNGSNKGSVTLDDFASDDAIFAKPDSWNHVLKNVRAGLMPPAGKPQPTAAELRTLETWIKRDAFRLDPANPDPGRVTLRRLNRVEYHNTIRDLMGIDFRADEEFPADDSGYGFDNIGDVLSVSPLLLEKYLQAAETIVTRAVPTVPRVVPTRTVDGSEFRGEGGANGNYTSLYDPAKLARTFSIEKQGDYRVTVNVAVQGDFYSDPGRARVIFKRDDRVLLDQEFSWEGNKSFSFPNDETLTPGEHTLTCEIQPLVPTIEKKTSVGLKIKGVEIDGPLDPSQWVKTPGYDRFFPQEVPVEPEARRVYTRDLLSRFATLAYRQPVADRLVDRLVAIAEETSSQPGKSFEDGAARGMVAVLASPRFLFRIEQSQAVAADATVAPLDEYALASRLSYFLWSTMPDATLIDLADRGELRSHLGEQVERMLADKKSDELIENFVGQWLQARDFEHFPIQHKILFRREKLPPKKDGEISSLRRAMRAETEAYFGYVVREDRPILELIDSDYAFVNKTLAEHYNIPDVHGREIQKVTLPAGSPRGGLLTQGGILMVTSNPTRTSPVKRGQFILENILGTPTPPPPPDIPSLEDTIRNLAGREPTTREVMETHRQDALCASCHNRMDPLGLAFENFNALGTFRTTERNQPIDATGKLLNGRTFNNAVELKKILVNEFKTDFYTCMTEKLLTYALGRGIDYYDVETVDAIVARLDQADGRFSALLMGVIESAPFGKRRVAPPTTAAASVPSPASAAVALSQPSHPTSNTLGAKP